MSLTFLNDFIGSNHAMESIGKYWPMATSSGTLLSMKKKREIPKFMMDIGLGPSIFLLTLKSLIVVFLMLTIINLPAIWIYYSGDQNTNFMSEFNLGHLGFNNYACGEENLAKNRMNIDL